jgi:hypothetical protein
MRSEAVKVSPRVGPSGNTALVGATMMFEILCVLAPAVHRRKNRMRSMPILRRRVHHATGAAPPGISR